MAYPPFHELSSQPPLFMTESEFSEAFSGEGSYVEFKQGVPEAKIAEAVVAFSNLEGGVILLGVSDRGEVVGLQATGETEAKVHRAVGAARDPGRYTINHLQVDERSILVVAVSRRREGFAQLPDGRVLLRRGAMNSPLLGQELSTFLTGKALTRFESTPTTFPLSAADPELTAALATVHGWTGKVEERLLDCELATRQSSGIYLTVAGVLYLTAAPRESLGKAYVEIFRYRDSSTWDRRTQIDGPIPRQVEETVRELTNELGSDVVIVGLRRHELPRIPEPVLREAVANAVAHRSYESSTQPVRVEIRSDRVTIRSPGGLPEPVTIANIRDQNAPRNLQIIKILRRFRLAEDAGLGVDLMQDQMDDAMLDPPTFETDGTYVAVELAFGGAVRPQERAWIAEVERRGQLRGRDKLVLLHAARGERLTNGSVRELLGVDSVHARSALTRLRDLGYLTQHGERGGATYSLARDLGPPPGLDLDAFELREVVLQLITELDRVTNEDVRRRTGLDRARALQLLNALVESGEIVRKGQRRGSHYARPGDDPGLS